MTPSRGEIWWADLSPVRGHEQAGCRPVLIVSVDRFNAGGSSLAVIAPITSRLRQIPFHVTVHPPEGGLEVPSAILCEAVRSVSRERLVRRMGAITSGTLSKVEDVLRILLGL